MGSRLYNAMRSQRGHRRLAQEDLVQPSHCLIDLLKNSGQLLHDDLFLRLLSSRQLLPLDWRLGHAFRLELPKHGRLLEQRW